jgi:glutamyl-tRNA synthetase
VYYASFRSNQSIQQSNISGWIGFQAFTPTSSRRGLTFFSSTTASLNGGAGNSSTLRRRRAPHVGDHGLKLVEQFQREQGQYRDIQYGRSVLGSRLDATLASTTEQQTATRADSIQIAQLPAVFPLEGKKVDEQPPRMRFAPSPTGSLHVGGARTALYNWLVAKKGQMGFPKSNSAFIVRVEDTDVERSTKASEDSVLADLRWLGLDWDEGPYTTPTEYGPYRQSERSDVYYAAAQRLVQEGKAYRCFSSNEELEEMKKSQEAAGQVFKYDGRWRDADEKLVNKMLDDQIPYTVRFKVPANARIVIDDVIRGTVAWDADATVGDFILLRSSGVPVYNFCVAVDDATMGITTVVRAEEHLTNTVRQALVLDALRAPRPRYAHCSLILGQDKQKLSKRHGATACDQYRQDGFLPDAMINYLALLGWNDGSDNEIFTRDELIDAFDLNRVVKSPSVFDHEKLKWVNAQHLKMMSVHQTIPLVDEQMAMEGVWKDDDVADILKKHEFNFAATALAKQMMDTTKSAVTNAKTVLSYHLPASFEDMDKDSEAKLMIERGHFYPLAVRILQEYEVGNFPLPNPETVMTAFQNANGQAIEDDAEHGASCPYTESYKTFMKSLAKETKIKGKNLFHPVRLMLTGEMSGQDVSRQLSLLVLACDPDSAVNGPAVGLVDFSTRMAQLRAFIETIPEPFRDASAADHNKSTKPNDSQASTTVTGSASASAATSSASSSTTSSTNDPRDTYVGPPITALDIRVGEIVNVWEHPEADKLYCEEINVGEDQPRSIASGLRPYLSKEEMLGRRVLVLCNLKERKLVGFPSHGMVLCASNADHSVVKLVSPPVDAKIGERVTVPDFDFTDESGAPVTENVLGKKKVWEQLAPHLITSRYGVPQFLGRPLMTSAGVCTSPIPDGTVS